MDALAESTAYRLGYFRATLKMIAEGIFTGPRAKQLAADAIQHERTIMDEFAHKVGEQAIKEAGA